ncbi:hypothetical protein [Hanstruepera flava]|uniref:hypothetical protein n=1 Tax=Hanstruepera flava TaxID=2930218 RepID=UPI002027DAFD|nr:hypothetical protein [Hanstruepera flava]
MRFISFLIIILLCSCQDSKSDSVEETSLSSTVEVVSKDDVQSLNYTEFVIDAKVERAISGWEKYNELQKVIVDIKEGNLTFLRDNNEIVVALIQELKSTIPEKVNSPHVMARIIALETKIFKLESNVNLSNANKENVLYAIKEVLVAFSNFNLQMNKKLEKESQNIQRPQ